MSKQKSLTYNIYFFKKILGVKHGGYMSNTTGKGLKSQNTSRVYGK